jgi:hypothetical protein
VGAGAGEIRVRNGTIGRCVVEQTKVGSFFGGLRSMFAGEFSPSLGARSARNGDLDGDMLWID